MSKSDIRQKLEGFELKWLATQIIQPNGHEGVSNNTFFSWVSGDRTMPAWLINELKRITGREL